MLLQLTVVVVAPAAPAPASTCYGTVSSPDALLKEFLYSPLTGLVLLDVHHVKESDLLTMNTVRSSQRPSNSVLDKEVCASIFTRARTICEIRGT